MGISVKNVSKQFGSFQAVDGVDLEIESGAVGMAFCLQAIATQTLPPCVGLKNPEFDIDLVRVPRQTDLNNLLCLSFGFGGQNTAIAIGKWQPKSSNTMEKI